jgi:hypothetical protein
LLCTPVILQPADLQARLAGVVERTSPREQLVSGQCVTPAGIVETDETVAHGGDDRRLAGRDPPFCVRRWKVRRGQWLPIGLDADTSRFALVSPIWPLPEFLPETETQNRQLDLGAALQNVVKNRLAFYFPLGEQQGRTGTAHARLFPRSSLNRRREPDRSAVPADISMPPLRRPARQ